MNKFDAFQKLLAFVNDEYEVEDADMNNYAGDIVIKGKDETGATITITVRMTEEEKDGN
jgi:hypothetical protein